MAVGVVSAAQEAKLGIHGDISVAGFDDAPIAQSVWPQLTTVRQPLKGMGTETLNVMVGYLRQICDGRRFFENIVVSLDYQIIFRDSTGRYPKV